MFPKTDDQDSLRKMCRHLRLSDWLFLQCVSRGMDNLNFKKVFEKVLRKYSSGQLGDEDDDDM